MGDFSTQEETVNQSLLMAFKVMVGRSGTITPVQRPKGINCRFSLKPHALFFTFPFYTNEIYTTCVNQ